MGKAPPPLKGYTGTGPGIMGCLPTYRLGGGESAPPAPLLGWYAASRGSSEARADLHLLVPGRVGISYQRSACALVLNLKDRVNRQGGKTDSCPPSLVRERKGEPLGLLYDGPGLRRQRDAHGEVVDRRDLVVVEVPPVLVSSAGVYEVHHRFALQPAHGHRNEVRSLDL